MGMAWTQKLPSGNYRGLYRLPDGSTRSAGTFPHKKRALGEASAKEREASAPGWRDPRAALRTWGDWCSDWWPTRQVEASTLKEDARSRDKHLLPRWGDVPLIDITRHEVRAWASELRAAGLAPSTVQKRVYLLSASLNAAIDAEIISVNPAFRLRLAGGNSDVRRYLSKEEMARLFDAIEDQFDRDLVSFLLGTGARWGEAIGMQVGRVDRAAGRVRIAEAWDRKTGTLKPYPKGKHARNVPIPPWLDEPLERLAGRRRSGFLFERDGHLVDYSNWRNKVWMPATRAAELEGARPHDLRHTFASWHLQAGTSLAEVGKMLGHTSAQTTAIYAHLEQEFRDEIRTRLAAPWGPGV